MRRKNDLWECRECYEVMGGVRTHSPYFYPFPHSSFDFTHTSLQHTHIITGEVSSDDIFLHPGKTNEVPGVSLKLCTAGDFYHSTGRTCLARVNSRDPSLSLYRSSSAYHLTGCPRAAVRFYRHFPAGIWGWELSNTGYRIIPAISFFSSARV